MTCDDMTMMMTKAMKAMTAAKALKAMNAMKALLLIATLVTGVYGDDESGEQPWQLVPEPLQQQQQQPQQIMCEHCGLVVGTEHTFLAAGGTYCNQCSITLCPQCTTVCQTCSLSCWQGCPVHYFMLTTGT